MTYFQIGTAYNENIYIYTHFLWLCLAMLPEGTCIKHMYRINDEHSAVSDTFHGSTWGFLEMGDLGSSILLCLIGKPVVVSDN